MRHWSCRLLHEPVAAGRVKPCRSERLRLFSAHFVATQVAFSPTLFKCQVQMCTHGNCFGLLSACSRCPRGGRSSRLRAASRTHDASCFMSSSRLSSHIPELIPSLLIALIHTINHKVGITFCPDKILCLVLTESNGDRV